MNTTNSSGNATLTSSTKKSSKKVYNIYNFRKEIIPDLVR